MKKIQMKKIIGLTILCLLISLDTFASVPTVAPSNLVFSNIAPTSMTIEWTNGNGNRRIVIASKNATPTAVLTSSDYAIAGNPNLFLAPSLGNGKVVHNAASRFVNLINMDWSSTYYFHIYEYNLISGVYYVNTANPSALRLSGSQITFPVEPTIPPSNPVFTNVTYQSLTLSWTSGNGSRRLVIASKDNAPNTLPDYFDFARPFSSTFGSGTAIGNGFIVYNGTANSLNITNLSPSSTYHFHIYDFNDLSNEYYYNTGVRLVTNTSTTALAAPTVISSGAVTVYNNIDLGPSFMASFANVGNGDGRIVLARLSSDPVQIPSNNTIYHQYNASTTPALNWKVGNNFIINVFSGGARAFNHTYATPGENYCFDVFEFNGNLAGGTAVFNTTPYTFCIKTPMASVPTDGPSNPVFSNVTNNSLKLSWTNGNGNRRMVVARKDTLPRAINATNFSVQTMDRAYNANANYGSGSALGAGFVVYQGTGNEVTVNNLELNGTYYFHIYEMNEFYHELTTTYYNVNNRVNTNRLVASASAPTTGAASLSFSSVGSSSLTLGWTNGNGTSRLVIARKSSVMNTDPTNNTAYTANPVFGNGSALGGGFVVYNGSGSSVNVTGLDPASTYFFTVIEYLTGSGTISYASSLKTSSSTTTTSSSSSTDTDEDGVPDEEDNFPSNAYMAFSTGYPAAGYGTMMFEDLWPGRGDYDFNDLVLNYHYDVVSDADDNVVEVRYSFVTRAIGGSLRNGFAFQLDGIPASSVDEVVRVGTSKVSGITYATFNDNGTEANQTNANIIVFKDAFDLLPRSSGFAFINVEAGAPDVGTDTTEIIVKFSSNGVRPEGSTAISITNFTHAVFNPYLIVGQDRGKEVHKPNRVPSSRVNNSYFGQHQDNSNPAQSIYYRTSTGLPWVLDVTESVPYATEKTDFTEAFVNFAQWATSGGASYTDWYQDLPNNRNLNKLFSSEQ
jgi:LruC domain-containing protein